MIGLRNTMRVCARLRSAGLALRLIDELATRARHNSPETKKNQPSVEGISGFAFGHIVRDGGKSVF